MNSETAMGNFTPNFYSILPLSELLGGCSRALFSYAQAFT